MHLRVPSSTELLEEFAELKTICGLFRIFEGFMSVAKCTSPQCTNYFDCQKHQQLSGDHDLAQQTKSVQQVKSPSLVLVSHMGARFEDWLFSSQSSSLLTCLRKQRKRGQVPGQLHPHEKVPGSSDCGLAWW